MIDEPVQYSRGRRKYANSGIEKRIMSSARRERTAISCASAERSAASHSPRAIDAPKQLWIVREKPSSFVVRARSSGSGTPYPAALPRGFRSASL